MRLISFADLPRVSDQQMRAMESSYRRGYSQGVSASLEAVTFLARKGFVRTQEIVNILDDWNCGPVMQWRCGPKASMELPPHPPRLDWIAIREMIIARDAPFGRFNCPDCGNWYEVSSPHARGLIHVDHIVPVALGGIPSLDNLRLVCRPCNLAKGAR